MTGLPDWNKEPSGSTPEQPAQQKRSAGLLLSGVLIAISLLAFILPLAAYHVAQVASILRVRTGLFLIALVSFSLYLLGLVTRVPVFMMAGTTGICLIPFLACSLFIRVKSGSAWWALIVLSLPIVFALVSLLSVPQGFNIEKWLISEFARLPPSNAASQQELLLQQVKGSPAFLELQKLFELDSWKRLSWFLFVDGGALSISLFASLLGTLVLIDFAFNQTERTRGVMAYVLQRKDKFPLQMVSLLEQTFEGMRALVGDKAFFRVENQISTPEVVSHEKKTVRSREQETGIKSIAKVFLREPMPPGVSDVFGYRFTFKKEPGWNLRSFEVPLLGSIPALALLVYLASLWRGEAQIANWLPSAPLGQLLSWSAFLAMFVVAAVAMQGALVVYACLRPLAALAAIFVLLLALSATQAGPLMLIALLAAIGLLDNVYDFRNRLAKNKNAV